MRLTFRDGKFILKGATLHVSETLWESSGDSFSTTNLKAAERFRPHADEVAERVFKRAFSVSYDFPPLPPLSFLDPHQREGIEWILGRKRSYLAHAPGAGKTCQAIVASSLVPHAGQTLFIVPPSLVTNWYKETIRFTHLMGYYPSVDTIVAGIFDSKSKADIIICADSMLGRDHINKYLSSRNWKFIAVDEASRLKEPTALRSLAFYGGTYGKTRFNGIYQNARHVVFMDGSPMPNRPLELWAPTYALHPLAIDSLGMIDFGIRYCGAIINDRNQWEFKGATRQAELKEKLQKDFMHVVTEESLCHPERRRSLLFVDDPRSKAERIWDQRNLKKINLQDLGAADSLGEIAEVRQSIGLAKLPFTVRYVRERLKEKNESILLFAWHREVCDLLALGLKEFDPFVLYGGVKSDKREKAFTDFQAGKLRLIIGNIQAAGRGHNLQRADRVIFCEYSWTDELNKQCEKRASRKGRAEADFVRCEYLVLPDSMDEVVLNAVFTKAKRVKNVIG